MTHNHNDLLLRQETRDPGRGIFPAVSGAVSAAAFLLATEELLLLRQTGSFLWGILGALCICLLYGICRYFGKNRLFYTGTLTLLLGLVVLFREPLLGGFCRFWNHVSTVYTSGTGHVLPELTVASSEGDFPLFFLFSGILTGLVFSGLSGLYPPLAALVPPVVLFAVMTLFSREPSFRVGTGILCLSAISLILYPGRQKKAGSGILFRMIPAALIAAATLCMATLPPCQDWTSFCQESIRQTLHTRRYETANTVLPEGDPGRYTEITGALPGLSVHMENPEAMYLRGFTGDVFDGYRWTELDTEILGENRDLLYWLNLNAFSPHAQLAQGVFSEDAAVNTVTVQNIGACSRFLYLPCSLLDTDLLSPEDLNTGGVSGNGQRFYTFTVLSGDPEQVLDALENADPQLSRSYREAESVYRKFVYDHYLQIPEETAEVLTPLWEEAAAVYGSPEELTLQQRQACVLQVLESCFEENGNASRILPEQWQSKGSFTYATVAVLTLRHFGIPARYAEGYVISQQMADTATDGTISADSRCAGSWAEVYQEGLGWLPMEKTPGFSQSPEDSSEDPDPTGGYQDPQEGQELEEDPESSTLQSSPTGGYQVSLPREILRAVPVLLLLLLLSIVLWLLHRHIVLKKRRSHFEGPDLKDSICRIFSSSALLLEKMGYRRGCGSMEVLIPVLEKDFGASYAGDFAAAMAVNAEALFSSHPMTEDSRKLSLAFYETTLNLLKAHCKWYRRLWLKMILCLY